MEQDNNTEYKGTIAFYYRGSWYHRKKEMLEDGTVKYGRLGGFKTPEEAEESYYKCLDIFEEQSRKYIAPIIDKEIMLKDYLIYWFEEIYKGKVDSNTSMTTSYSIYNLIIPNLPYEIKLRLTTSDYINEVLEKIDKLGKTTANKSRETLNLAFEEAKSNNILTVNPVISSKYYPRGEVNITILTEKEIKLLLEEAIKGSWYLEVLLGLFCGLRKGEIMGLKFSDINYEKQTVRIQRQIILHRELEPNTFKIKSSILIESDPKTINSFRTLRLPKVIINELKKREELIKSCKEKLQDKYNDNNYISCRSDGTLHAMTSLNGYLNKICPKIGIPRITVHGLRHMFATIFMEQKSDIEQTAKLAKLSALLGHSSIHTTFDFYCSVMEEKKKIAAFMNNTFPVQNEVEV